jgi:hypothetical protein
MDFLCTACFCCLIQSLAQLHNILIQTTTNLTYKEMHETNSTLHNSVQFKHHYETKKSSSVITLLGRYHLLLHHLGELVSCRGAEP